MSTIVTPVHQRFVVTPADFVMSANRMLPLFRYRRLDTMLPARKMSGSPSLLISPIATPAPLYTYASVSTFKESSVMMVFANGRHVRQYHHHRRLLERAHRRVR